MLYAGLTYNTSVRRARRAHLGLRPARPRPPRAGQRGRRAGGRGRPRGRARRGACKRGRPARALSRACPICSRPARARIRCTRTSRSRATRRPTARSRSSCAARRRSSSTTPSGSRCPRLVVHARPRDRRTRRSTTSRASARTSACSSRARPAAPGIYAVACAVLRGARVTGLVSTEDKGRLVARAAARGAYVNRKAPEVAGAFTPVPLGAPRRAAWRAAGRRLRRARARAATTGRSIDVVVSSVGRDLFGRMIDLLGPGGRLVFYGATSGYTLAFLGKPGAGAGGRDAAAGRTAPERTACSSTRRGRAPTTPVGDDAIGARAGRAGARVVVATRARRPGRARAGGSRVHGVVSLETLARGAGVPLARDDAGLRSRPRRLSRVPGRHAQAVRPGRGTPPRHARQPARQSRT